MPLADGLKNGTKVPQVGGNSSHAPRPPKNIGGNSSTVPRPPKQTRIGGNYAGQKSR